MSANGDMSVHKIGGYSDTGVSDTNRKRVELPKLSDISLFFEYLKPQGNDGGGAAEIFPANN